MRNSFEGTPLLEIRTIDATSGQDVRQWAMSLGVSEEQLLEVIVRVGNRVDNIERYIQTIGR